MIKWVLGYYYEKEKNSFLGPRKATLRHLVSFSFSGGSVWMDTHGILFFFFPSFVGFNCLTGILCLETWSHNIISKME